MSKETQIGKEKGLNQLKLSLWENDKGESDTEEEASLRPQGLQRMKEKSAIKGIQDGEMDEGIKKLLQQDFKESYWWKMGFGDAQDQDCGS